MILGIGVDIAKVSRFQKWVNTPELLHRFFNDKECFPLPLNQNPKSMTALYEHYAARFCAKEAFSKALGCGLSGFELKDVYIIKDTNGVPLLCYQNSALVALQNFAKSHNLSSLPTIHISLSHEREFAIAFVIIESN